MDSIKITKRTKYIRDTIQREWHDRYWQFIIDNLDKDWVWGYISENPNITIRDILDNPDKDWDRSNFYNNPFLKDKEEFIIKKYREHFAAILIQNAYKNALVNPNCKIGRNRIERDMVFAGI